MISLIRTAASNSDFNSLVKLLDAELAISDGEDHNFYNQFNKLDAIKHVIVAYIDDIPVGCGAIKEYKATIMEVKRMFTKASFRGKGVAKTVLFGLEKWAAELGHDACILETGIKQPEAIALYLKCEYHQIDNYGQYKNVVDSLCFKKQLNK
jgi:GNAT superfamily N-acetyltransferase